MENEIDPEALAELPRPIGRRLFLTVAGLGSLGVIFGATFQRIETKILKTFGSSNGRGGLAALVPGAYEFRIYTVSNSIPSIPKSSFRLRVDGLVAHPHEFTYEELLALPETSLTKDFQCVTGWRVPNVPWRGVLLRDLLDVVKPHAGATGVEFGSYDGIYTESLTLDEARRSDVLIAYEMLGAPITQEHGGPVRLYVAPMYGYKSAKWLQSISLVARTTPGYWEQYGYDVEGWIGRSNGRSDTPIDA